MTLDFNGLKRYSFYQKTAGPAERGFPDDAYQYFQFHEPGYLFPLYEGPLCGPFWVCVEGADRLILLFRMCMEGGSVQQGRFL